MKKFASVLMLSAVSVFAEPQVSKVSFFAIGDVLMHSALYKECEQDASKCNYDRFFAEWKADIEAADYACVNQETVFIPRKDKYSTYPTFGSPEEVGLAEVNAGFDIVTHATNHTMDRQAKGVDYTLDFWKDKPVMVLGIHGTAEDQAQIRYDEKKGIKFAFLNFTYGLNAQKMPDDRKYMVDMLDSEGKWLKRIAEADRNAEVVVAFLHMGTEYTELPDKDARSRAEKAIDAGADILVCAHPHVIEPFGVVKTKKGNKALVFWSLGNYISNQFRLGTILGGVAKFEVQKTVDGDSSKIEVTDAKFEGSITYLDDKGYTTIPLDKYTEELHVKHAWSTKVKGFTVKSMNDLFKRVVGSYSKCGTQDVSKALPIAVKQISK
jgi:poly-gamma-glutamate synthesis protein (capsule biosynthesis protein)